MKPYIYIFIRKDLPPAQRVVQSSHVAWELSKKHNLDFHPSMIVIGINNLEQLQKQQKKLVDSGFEISTFIEPLFDNELTGFGLLAKDEEERTLLKKYQLLSDLSFITQNENKYKAPVCNHNKTRLDLVETFAYEHTPARICKQCYKEVTRHLTDQEKKQAVRSFYKDILETELSEPELELKKNGFNL